MKLYGIHILCLQETRKPLSDFIETEEGFILILSGRVDVQEKEYAGVGFLVAPELRRSIYGFCQLSSRLACLKIRIPKGKLAILSCYSPHAGKDFEERFEFFQTLNHFWKSISSHDPRICMGDFNSRLYCRFAGEEQILGEFTLKNNDSLISNSNKYLLIEFCSSYDL